jgi:threonine synthase
LGQYLSLKNLWIKDESRNFTKTFKARDATIALSRFQEISLKGFVLSSTGNTAAAFCHAMRFTTIPMKVTLFLPKSAPIDFPIRKEVVARLTIVDGAYQACIETAKAYSSKAGLNYEGGFANPSRIEGSKTLALELAETNVEPEWYVQAITSGTGVYAFYKGFSELQNLGVIDRIPRILCVQPEGCAPIVRAYKRGRESLRPDEAVDEPATFVLTLTNGNPSFSYPYVRSAVLRSKGEMESVTEKEIAEAFLLLVKFERILPDPAAAVALAGMIKSLAEGVLEKDSTILFNLSGGLRTFPSKGIPQSITQQVLHPPLTFKKRGKL